jgi:hypothetical protein
LLANVAAGPHVVHFKEGEFIIKMSIYLSEYSNNTSGDGYGEKQMTDFVCVDFVIVVSDKGVLYFFCR